MSKKNHYRNVFKSDHLSAADLEDMQEDGKDLVFTIKNVKQLKKTKVAGKKIDANIAYFNENIKPLVLNATNSKIVAKLTGSNFVEDWNNVVIELYVQRGIAFAGKTVDGIRIKPSQPKKQTRNIEQRLNECVSIAQLQRLWNGLSEQDQTVYAQQFNTRKLIIQKKAS